MSKVEESVFLFIQARTGSQRLPSKILLPMDGDITLLEFLIRRLQRNPLWKGKIVLLTTCQAEDQVLIQIAKQCGIESFCGDEENVLSRFIEASRHYSSTHIIRICADSPWIDPFLVEQMYAYYLQDSSALLTVNPEETRLLDGIEIISTAKLQEIPKQMQSQPRDALDEKNVQEHVTWYYKMIQPDFSTFPIPSELALLGRFCIDTLEDYEINLEWVRQVKQEGYDPLQIRASELKKILKM